MIFRLVIVISLVLIFIACGGSSTSDPTSATNNGKNTEIFESLHELSEDMYDGNGTWGVNQYASRMALRDSYWRADVYGILSNRGLPSSNVYGLRAEQVANYLKQVQSESGGDVFGFPADVDNPEFGETVAQTIEQCPECILNGWIITLPGDMVAELYYDHGYALTSVAREYIRTNDQQLLNVITAAADWALDKPLHSNLNYLSALSKGLSYAYEVTGEQAYLDRAVYLHEFGIIPNLSTENGGALDSHNQQLEYHGFIVSGLIALAQIIPEQHPFASEVNRAMELAINHMQQRNMEEPAPYEATWPGTNLFAWHELSQLRPLTTSETQARDQCVNLIKDYKSLIEQEMDFRLRKALYVNFFIGIFSD